MSKRGRKRKPPPPARFKVGDRVRVKHGVMDTEYPDMSLGGWAETISEIDRHGIYTVQWSEETLASIHPIYKKRCERDGMVLEEYWLKDGDLEADPGGPLSIEQPKEITPKPLSPENQDDRVRMVFGLTSDDLLPKPDRDSLETYYDYLVEQMSLPVEARYCPQEDFLNPASLRKVNVVALDGEFAWDEEEGILCKIRSSEREEVVPLTDLEFRGSDPNHQLLDDFSAWFFGDLSEEMDDGDGGDDEDVKVDDELDEREDNSDVLEPATWRGVVLLILEIIAFATSYGAVVGAAVAAMPWARWAAYIGIGFGGVFLAITQVRYAQREMTHLLPRYRKSFSAIRGLITGAIQGALYGIMVVAFVGAVLGGIVGVSLRRLFGDTKSAFFHVFPGSLLFAAACGVTAQAFYTDRIVASEGLRFGAEIGLGIALLFCLASLPLAFLMVRRPVT